MAEGGAAHETTPLQDVVTCKVCYTYMQDSLMLYPCMHAFCKQCVGRLDKSRHQGQRGVKCPLCRSFTARDYILPHRMMNDLANHVISEEVQTGASQSDLQCVQCDSKHVTSICSDCQIELCQKCTNGHMRIPNCRNHKVLAISEAKKVKRRNITVYCQKHQNEEIKMNCKKCNIAICSVCKFNEHDTHKSENLESALARYRPLVKLALDNINKKSSQRKQQIALLKHMIQQVKKGQQKAQLQLDASKNEVINRINQEYEQLTSELDTNSGAEIKGLELHLEELEHSLTCDESVKTWTEAITDNTEGGGLITELQGGLLDKIQHLQQPLPKAKSQDCNVYKYTQSQFVSQLPSNVLGTITTIQVPVRNYSETLSAELSFSEIRDNSNHSYRLVKTDLNTLIGREMQGQTFAKVGTHAYRMCIFQNKIFIPCYNNTIIKVFSLEGSLLDTIQLNNIIYPRSLHPLDSNQLVLASNSGLHTLDNTGRVTSQIHTGKFDDVYIEGNVMAAQRCDEQKVYEWDVRNTSQPTITFPVALGNLTDNTLCILKSDIYVCDRDHDKIYKYNMQGKCVNQYGESGRKEPGKLYDARLSMTDTGGNMLLCDYGNNRVQLLSASGQWSVLRLNINEPLDAVIDGNTLYILHGYASNNKISKYII